MDSSIELYDNEKSAQGLLLNVTEPQINVAVKNVVHFATAMKELTARNLINEIIIGVDKFGEDIRKIKWSLPLPLCREVDEIDVNFAVNYIFHERRHYQHNKSYSLFTDDFFEDEPQENDYGSLQNPIKLPSVAFSYIFLDNLIREQGNKFTYKRIGSKLLPGAEIVLDIYTIICNKTDKSSQLVINPYADRYYTFIPSCTKSNDE